MKFRRLALVAMAVMLIAASSAMAESAVDTIMNVGTTQAFTDEAVSMDDLKTIMQAGLSAASAINQQPWFFVAVTNQDVMKEISGSGMGFAPPAGAPGKPEGAPQGEKGPFSAAPASGGVAKAGLGDSPAAIIIYRSDSNLSKGYRQRVGIAQALLGNPEVIILDEPTVGLDPAQIIEIRDLIRALGKDHTIILSSHILSEVQTVCDSIMIISAGRLVASDTPENLTKLFAGTTTLHLEVKGSEAETAKVLDSVLPIEDQSIKAGPDGTTFVEIKPVESADIREAVFAAFAGAKVPLLEMRTVRASLEDVFLELTQGDAQPILNRTGKEASAGNGFSALEAPNAEQPSEKEADPA